jgi:hypothetical protein
MTILMMRKFMNNENLDIAHPDPAWDYYPLWHSLHHIKAKIDAALKLINQSETLDPKVDKQAREILDLASDKLIEVVHQLEHDDEEL